MANCSECKNSIWDEVWGEYKCSALHHRIYDPNEYSNCKYFDEGKPTDSNVGYEEARYERTIR